MTRPRARPKDSAAWDQRYIDGQLPWDSGQPDEHLAEVIEAYGIQPGKALEIGCGTGTNAIWLARQGFTVTGTDLAPTAIAKAAAKIAAAGVDVEVFAADFLQDAIPGGPYEFVYDRGCLHCFNEPVDRSRFAARVGELITPDGLWHSLIGSTDGPPRDSGPPRQSAADIVTAVEPHFEILELRSTTFDRERHSHARAWQLVARRRVFYPE